MSSVRSSALRFQRDRDDAGSPLPLPLRALQPALLGRLPGVLPGLLRTRVIPELVRRHAGPAGIAPAVLVDPQLAVLARLLIAAEPDAAFGLIDALQPRKRSIRRLCNALLEPAARILGDLWADDDCSEFDVTLGLSRLQMALRRITPARLPRPAQFGTARAVLIAPQPGEPHMLGAAMASALFWQAGWDTRCAFPTTDHSLGELVSGSWFDALDLSLSAAFLRTHWLPRLTETIAQARRASRNPALLILVDGRAFGDSAAAGVQVGADLSCATGLALESLPSRSLQALRA